MLRYLPVILVVAFTLYCVFDVLGSDERARRGAPAPVWLLLVLLLPVLGGVVWLVVSRGSAHGGGSGPHRRGPVAPDDDPEFLFRLDQERRRREQQDGDPDAAPREGSADGSDASGTTDGTPSA